MINRRALAAFAWLEPELACAPANAVRMPGHATVSNHAVARIAQIKCNSTGDDRMGTSSKSTPSQDIKTSMAMGSSMPRIDAPSFTCARLIALFQAGPPCTS